MICIRIHKFIWANLKLFGIVLCCISVVPVVFFGILFNGNFFSEALGPSMIFILTGLGVFFILFSTAKDDAYKKLLSLG